MLKLDLQQQDPANQVYKKINTYTCLIRVAPGLCSTGIETLTSLAKLYKIKYELDNGTIPGNVTTTSYNQYTKFKLPTPTRGGDIFLGWCTHENCPSESCEQLQEEGKTILISQDTTFYAKWQEQQTSPEPSDPTNGLSYFSKQDDSGDNIECLNIHTAQGLALYRDIVNGTLTEEISFYKNNYLVKTIKTTNTGRIDAYLMADITVDNWIPIGIYNGDTASNKLYSSNFYGNGYTITINSVDSSATNVGLFGYAGNYESPNTISNLIVKGDFSTVTPKYAGGIVSYAMGVNIENCVNYATIKATFSAGGIVGYIGKNSTNSINKCINLGEIQQNTDVYYGGIAGFASSTVYISDCINLKDLPVWSLGSSSGIVFVDTNVTSSIDRCINVGKSACPSAYAIANSGVNSNCYYNTETTYDGWQDLIDKSYENVIQKNTAELCNLKAEDLSDQWSFAAAGAPSRYPLPDLSKVNETVWSAITSAEEVVLPEIEVPSTEFINGAYYVSDSGSDSSDGLSAEASYKTLKKAISSANNSSENRIIYVTGTLDPTTEGIEKPSNGTSNSNSVFYIQESGFTNQIQIIGYNDAIFSGNNATRIFSTENSYNFKFKNITFQNANTSGSGGAFYYYKGILELENCNFRANVDNGGGSAIYVYGGEGQLNLTQTNCEDNIYAYSATVTINDDCIIGKEGSTNRITLDYSTLILNGSNINIFESVYIKSTSSKIKIGENYVHGEDKIKIMIAGSILSTNFLLVQECSESIKEYFEVISEDGEKTYTLNDEGYVSE